MSVIDKLAEIIPSVMTAATENVLGLVALSMMLVAIICLALYKLLPKWVFPIIVLSLLFVPFILILFVPSEETEKLIIPNIEWSYIGSGDIFQCTANGESVGIAHDARREGLYNNYPAILAVCAGYNYKQAIENINEK